MKLTTLLTALLMLSGLSAAAQYEGTNTFPTPAKPETASEWKPHIGVTAGYTNAEGDFTSTLGYGLDFGVQPYIPFGVGAELATTDNEGDLRRTTLLGRATYNFGGSIPVINKSYVGALLGPVWDTESRDNGVRFGIGPVAGFDIPLGQDMTNNTVTLGLNARYVFVNESQPDTFQLNGAMKYWF